MIERAKDGWRDILLAAGCMIFAVFMYANTLDLPDAVYDPLGPAYMPRLLCTMIVVVSGVILSHGIRKLLEARGTRQPPDASGGDTAAENAGTQPGFRRHPVVAAMVIFGTFLYILSLDLGLSGFKTLTILFILAIGILLLRTEMKKFPWTHWLILATIAVAMGFGLYYLFTEVFVVDLY